MRLRCDDPRPDLNESGIDMWGLLPWKHSIIPRVENNTVRNAYVGLRIGIWVDDWRGLHIEGAYANASYNNFSGNRRYGISILNQTDDTSAASKLSLWWNDLAENGEGGVLADYDLPTGWFWNARCNWWGDASGPNDPLPGNPDTNVNPAGEPVSDYFHYRDEQPPPPPQVRLWWLQSPAAQATFCHP